MLLAGCVPAGREEAARLLADIDAGAGPSGLKAATPAPARSAIGWRGPDLPRLGDLYSPAQPALGRLVVVPGFTIHGKDDPRLVELAESLARARFLVLVPEIAGARALRVRLEDRDAIADAARHLARIEGPDAPVGVVAISYAAGLAALAALRPGTSISYLVLVGGYHDTVELARFIARDNAAGGGDQLLPAAKAMFLASHAALLADPAERAALLALAERRMAGAPASLAGLGPQARSLLALVDNRDPESVERLVAALPAPVRGFLAALSLRGRDLSPLEGRLVLIHGRADRVIPWQESRDLAAAVPGTELFVIDGFSHIEPGGMGIAGRLQLVEAVHALLRRRDGRP
jgi:alpha-beta hydrolase superfamily lysophospholipase